MPYTRRILCDAVVTLAMGLDPLAAFSKNFLKC